MIDPIDAQDLALAVHARWVFDVPPTELEELADAVLAWADEQELEELLDRAVARCWGSTIETDLREALDELAGLVPECRHRVRSALLDLDARHSASQLARAFMLQCATQYAHEGLPLMFCLCCVEERLMAAEASERPGAAFEVARIAFRDVEIDEDEIAAAVRACALNPGGVSELLATDERRKAVRHRLSRIAAFAARSLPMLSRELRAALRQSAGSAPGDDPVWDAVCFELTRRCAAPAQN